MIPKIIHKLAPKNKNNWHPIWENCLSSWKTNFIEEEYEYIMWDDEKIDNLIEDKFPEYLNFYNSLPFHIMQLDLVRFCILYEYGGIYSDMDYFCCQNFYDELDSSLVFVESSASNEIIQNSLMASSKNNLFFMNLIEESKKTFYYYELITNCNSEKKDDYIKSITGPILISNYYKNLSEEEKQKIQLLDKNEYCLFLGEQEDKLNYDIKCIHFLTGMWGKDIFKSMCQSVGDREINLKDYIFSAYLQQRKKIYEKYGNLLNLE